MLMMVLAGHGGLSADELGVSCTLEDGRADVATRGVFGIGENTAVDAMLALPADAQAIRVWLGVESSYGPGERTWALAGPGAVASSAAFRTDPFAAGTLFKSAKPVSLSRSGDPGGFVAGVGMDRISAFMAWRAGQGAAGSTPQEGWDRVLAVEATDITAGFQAGTGPSGAGNTGFRLAVAGGVFRKDEGAAKDGWKRGSGTERALAGFWAAGAANLPGKHANLSLWLAGSAPNLSPPGLAAALEAGMSPPALLAGKGRVSFDARLAWADSLYRTPGGDRPDHGIEAGVGARLVSGGLAGNLRIGVAADPPSESPEHGALSWSADPWRMRWISFDPSAPLKVDGKLSIAYGWMVPDAGAGGRTARVVLDGSIDLLSGPGDGTRLDLAVGASARHSAGFPAEVSVTLGCRLDSATAQRRWNDDDGTGSAANGFLMSFAFMAAASGLSDLVLDFEFRPSKQFGMGISAEMSDGGDPRDGLRLRGFVEGRLAMPAGFSLQMRAGLPQGGIAVGQVPSVFGSRLAIQSATGQAHEAAGDSGTVATILGTIRLSVTIVRGL